MGTLYLVRHGQASFGADDYDQLSPLGQRQGLRLGQYLRERFGGRLRFEAVLTGTLRRQRQTWAAIAEGAGLAQPTPRTLAQAADVAAEPMPHLLWPGLNEYDSHAVIHAVHPEPLPKPDTPELYRLHFRLLREGLTRWMHGEVAPVGMPSYADFVAGVVGALEHVRAHSRGDVLLVSSGGPIATAVGHVLATPPESTIELNMRIRNTAVTEFAFTPKRHMLLTYNTLPHLDTEPYRDWLTYA
ncbi:MAG: histidine phosphatase family protein [Proteobacteria bacterium]|nr:histidine phosphatase family protein [Pseudomonadota bacterium]